MSSAYDAIGDDGPKSAPAAPPAAPNGALPELNLYLEPIHPASEMHIRDRAQLVLQSARPWSDFADVSQFNIPPLSAYKLRLQTNVETFFYNYFLLALVFLVIFAFGHLPSVVALVSVLAVAFFLYVLHPEPIEVAGAEIGTPAKHAIVVALALLALTVGHVFTLILSLAVFLLILVGVHGSIREVNDSGTV